MKLRVFVGGSLLITSLSLNAAETVQWNIPGWQGDSGSIPSVDHGVSGDWIGFQTTEALVPDDSNTGLDGYLFNHSTGQVMLAIPESSDTFSVLGDSLYSRAFSKDGSRVLLGAYTDFGRSSGDYALSALVYEFATQDYILASVDESGNTISSNNERFSGDGRYVFFSIAEYIGGEWLSKYYRNDTQTGETLMVLAKHDGTPFSEDDDLRIGGVSHDGSRFTVRVLDGALDAGDQNGRADTYLIDISDGSKTMVSWTFPDGSVASNLDFREGNAAFSRVLMSGSGITSQYAGRTVNERHAVFDVESGTLKGLSDFLNLSDKFVRSFIGDFPGAEVRGWSDRYVLMTAGPYSIPGDYIADPKMYMFDLETEQAWVAGLDADGNFDPFLGAYAIDDVYFNTQNMDPGISLSRTTVNPHDLKMTMSGADERVVITLTNDGEEDIYNVAISVLGSETVLDAVPISASSCRSTSTTETGPRLDCRVGTISAGGSQEISFAVAVGEVVTVESVSLSDPDSDKTGNRQTVTVAAKVVSPEPEAPPADSGSGGGGSFGWLILLLAARLRVSPLRG